MTLHYITSGTSTHSLVQQLRCFSPIVKIKKKQSMLSGLNLLRVLPRLHSINANCLDKKKKQNSVANHFIMSRLVGLVTIFL